MAAKENKNLFKSEGISSEVALTKLDKLKQTKAFIVGMFLMLFSILVAVYSKSFHTGFAFDDWGNLGWVINFSWREWWSELSPLSGSLYSTTVLFWRLLYANFGFDSYYYHLVHLAVHMVNILLVYILAKSLGCNRTTSFLASSFFAFNSALVTAVAWLSAGIDLPLVLFGIPAILCYKMVRERRGNLYLFYPLTILFFFLALKAKVMGLSVLAAFFVYDLVFLMPNWRWEAVRKAALPFLKFNLPFWVIGIVHMAIYQYKYKQISTSGEYGYSISPLNYLQSSVWYLNQVLGGTDIHSGVIAFVGIAAMAFAFSQKNKILIFGALLFFLGLFPVAILKIHHYPHHLYFPIIGVAIYVAEALNLILSANWLQKRKIAPAVTIALFFSYVYIENQAINDYTNNARHSWHLVQKTLLSLKSVLPVLPSEKVRFLIYPRPPASLFDFPESIQMTYSQYRDIEVQVFDVEDAFLTAVRANQKDNGTGKSEIDNIVSIPIKYDPASGEVQRFTLN